MSTVFLIRHGESEKNKGLPTAHLEGDNLTTLGNEQARDAANYLHAHTSLDLIVTSSYQRTKDTADCTRELFPKVPLKQWKVHEFTYLSSLHHEISTREQRKPLVQDYWERADPHYVNGPESESFEAFIKRANELLKALKSMKKENIAIFSHEQFITAVLWLIDRDPKQINRQAMHDFKYYLSQESVPNGGIIQLQCLDLFFVTRWHYKRINDHLEQTPSVQQVPEVALPI